jgi:hypothetical protein
MASTRKTRLTQVILDPVGVVWKVNVIDDGMLSFGLVSAAVRLERVDGIDCGDFQEPLHLSPLGPAKTMVPSLSTKTSCFLGSAGSVT